MNHGKLTARSHHETVMELSYALPDVLIIGYYQWTIIFHTSDENGYNNIIFRNNTLVIAVSATRNLNRIEPHILRESI